MFAVLVPSYNHHRFLVDAVLSALRSPLVTQLLIVDDGSTDRSRDLLPVLRDLDRRVCILEEASTNNLGAHARLNQLVTTASAEWLSILNSDDLFASGRFEVIAGTAAAGKADVIFGDLVIINQEGARKGLRNAVRHNEIAWPIGWDAHDLAHRGEWLKLLAVQNIVATTTNLVFSKEIFEKVGGFRNFRYCHDWDFALRCALRGRLHYSPLMLSMYRSHGLNTIKEGRHAVTIEVLQMFRDLLQDYPELKRDRGFGMGFRFNPYICRSSGAPLVVVMPASISVDLRQATSEENLPVQFVERLDEVPSGLRYIYAPTGDLGLLSPNELRNLALAIAVRPYDAFLLSRTLEPYPLIGAGSIADLVVPRTDATADWTSGNVRVVRSYTAAADPRPVEELVDLANAAVDSAVAESPIAMNWEPTSEVASPAVRIAGNDLPVVFVLPAFLALGGAERVAIDTMRLLVNKYKFVVINTEPLRPEQGSLHQEAAAHAHVYDLAEIVRRDDRLQALQLLAGWYSPVLVWICNGSPWQIEHSLAIRELFSDLPIVDNQAYDHEHGWIAYYNQPGVRAADRFVAINQKIRQSMISNYELPADQIDLVYHGFDPRRTQRPDIAVEEVAELRARFGLPSAHPVYGMVGRLSAQKRPLDLIRLAERLQNVNFPAHLVWVGSGELEANFKALAVDLGLKNVSLIPAQRDIQPVFAMLSGLLITSAFEGLPVAMLEALSMGIPVLSTDVGAIGEVLRRFGSGMVFGPVGDPDALEQAFYKFVADLEALRYRAVQSAPATVASFSITRMAREYDLCFQTAIARFRDPGTPQRRRLRT
jgi:glycosyltransferase involved in cell wall biosynthesis/GT2 family glycosyltransferase